MASQRMLILLITVVLGALAALVLVLQPYSADFPGRGFAKPSRTFIHAAIRHDSIGLQRVSATADPVVWGLRAGRRHRDSLAAWARHIEAWAGARHGDTTEVLVYGENDRCDRKPIILRFVGSGSEARVWSARAVCIDSGT